MPFGLGPAQPLDQANLGALGAWTPDPANAPVDQAAPAAPQPPPAVPQAYKPSMWDIAQGVLFDGQSPAEAAMSARQRAYQAQTLQQLPELLAKLPTGVRAAALMGGPKVWDELAKNWSPQTRSAGQETDYFGGSGKEGGYTRGTDTFSVDDKSGAPISNGPQGGFRRLGPSLGGDFSAKDGLILSGRTGGVSGHYETPQSVPHDHDLMAFLPGYAGAGGSGAVGGDAGSTNGFPTLPNAAPTAGQGAASTTPRGIRNLNFGNVRPLASGQKWDGQTGVDSDGYAVFATPQDGIKASLTNLQSYAKQGINTPMGIAARWAPAGDGKNDPATYAHFLAGQLGVGPNDTIDLSNPQVQKGVLNGIFNFENGAKAMAAWRHPAPVAATGAAPGSTSGSTTTGSVRTVAQGREPMPMGASERARWGIPDSDARQYVLMPDGKPQPVAEAAYGPKDVKEQRNSFFASPEYTDYTASVNAANAIESQLKTFAKNNSVLDQAAVDNSIRAMTGLSAKQGSVVNFMEHLGLPDQLKGNIQRVVGSGYITPEVLLQMRDMIRAYGDGHRTLAQYRLENEQSFAKGKGQDLGISALPQMVDKSDVPYLHSGAGKPPAGGDDPIAQARAAIAQGASRDAVISRLRQHGINPAGL